MSGKVKISEFPQTNSIANTDLVLITKQVGSSYRNYIVTGADFSVPSSSYSLYADSVKFSNILNKPTLVSSSAQFNSTDNPTFGNVTASNLRVSGTISGSSLDVSTEVSAPLISTNELDSTLVLSENLFVASASLIHTLLVTSGSNLSGSNTIGDINSTQSLNGEIIINGNIQISSSGTITADSASFQVIAPLASASISNIFSTNATITSVYATVVSASHVSSSHIRTTTASIDHLFVSSSATVLGSLNATASNSISASYAVTASYVSSATGTSSYAYTASIALTSSLSVSSSYASTAASSTSASFASSAAQSVTSSYASTSSYALNALTASYAVVIQVFSNSGSYVTTASNALSNLTASYANTASLAKNAISASYAANVVSIGLSYVLTASNTVGNLTSSYAQTASALDPNIPVYIPSASFGSASIANLTIGNTTGTASYASNAGTASYVINNTSISSSYALTSSYASTAAIASVSVTSSYSFSAAFATSSAVSNFSLTSSYANTAAVAITASNTISASNYVFAQSVRKSVSQSHTFLSGNVITIVGANAVLAQANTLSGSNTFGIVESSDYISGSLTSGSSYTIVQFGTANISGSSLTTGATYYLSDIIPGGWAQNPPSNPASFNQPIFIAQSPSQAFVYKVSPTLPYGQTASYAFTSSYNLDSTLRNTYLVVSASSLYSVGQALYLTSLGSVGLATAFSENSSRVLGIVSAVTATSVTVIFGGRYLGALTSCSPGDIIYLSDVIPGGYTNSKSTLMSGSVIKPIATAVSATEFILFNQYATNEFVGNAAFAQTASYASVAGSLLGSLPINGNSLRDTISASNSFVPGNVIGSDAITKQTTLCIADSLMNSNALGIIESANSSSFTIVYSGKIYLPANTFSPTGSLYYLSPTISGSFQSTPPNAGNQVVKSIVYSINDSTGIVTINSSIPVTASFAQTASVALFANLAFNSLNSNTATTAVTAGSSAVSVTSSYAVSASSLTELGLPLTVSGVSSSLNATTSSVVTYLNVKINGVAGKIAIFNV